MFPLTGWPVIRSSLYFPLKINSSHLIGRLITSETCGASFWYEELLMEGYRSSIGWFPDRTSLGLLLGWCIWLCRLTAGLGPVPGANLLTVGPRSRWVFGNLFPDELLTDFLTIFCVVVAALPTRPPAAPCRSMKTVLRFSFSFLTSTIFSPNLERKE